MASNSSSSSSSGQICAICLNRVVNGIQTSKCDNKHMFHMECIQQAMLHGHPACPYNCGGIFNTADMGQGLTFHELDGQQNGRVIVSVNRTADINGPRLCSIVGAEDNETNMTQLVVLLIDKSGSMSGSKEAQVKAAIKRLIKVLVDHGHRTGCDHGVAIIPFNNVVTGQLPVMRLGDSERLEELHHHIDSYISEGGTMFGPPVAAALNIVKDPRYEKAVKTVLLLTDGAAPVEPTLHEMCAGIDKVAGVLNVIGFGSDHDVVACTQIAQIGRGRYLFIPDEADGAKPEQVELAMNIGLGNMLASMFGVISQKYLLNVAGTYTTVGNSKIVNQGTLLGGQVNIIDVGRVSVGDDRDVAFGLSDIDVSWVEVIENDRVGKYKLREAAVDYQQRATDALKMTRVGALNIMDEGIEHLQKLGEQYELVTVAAEYVKELQDAKIIMEAVNDRLYTSMSRNNTYAHRNQSNGSQVSTARAQTYTLAMSQA